MRDYHFTPINIYHLEEAVGLYHACFAGAKLNCANPGTTAAEELRGQIRRVLECGMSWGVWHGEHLVGMALSFDYSKMATKDDAMFLSIFGENGALLHEGDLHSTIRGVAKKQDVIYLLTVVVLPEHRRKHIATKLLNRIIEAHPNSVIAAAVTNVSALPIYHQQNFTVTPIGSECYMAMGPGSVLRTGISDIRLRHMLGVARRMYELAKEHGHTEEEAQEFFVLGLLHDIGYEFDNGKHHGAVGATILKRLGYRDWEPIELHGEVCDSLTDERLLLLNIADMTVSTSGEPMTMEERTEDVGARYGRDTKVYRDTAFLAERLQEIARLSDWHVS